MLPAAPPMLSTITDCPSDTRMRSLKMRASTSAGPAAGNGTTIVIGRVGKACAAALRDAAGKMAAAAARFRTRGRNRRRGRLTMFHCGLMPLLVDELRPVPDFVFELGSQNRGGGEIRRDIEVRQPFTHMRVRHDRRGRLFQLRLDDVRHALRTK